MPRLSSPLPPLVTSGASSRESLRSSVGDDSRGSTLNVMNEGARHGTDGGGQTEPRLVVLIGDAGDNGELVRAARLMGAVVLIAPNIQTARAWLDKETSPARISAPEDGATSLGGLVVDLQSQQALWRGTSLALTVQELRLLAALTERPDTVWSFVDLSQRVWGSSYHGDRSMIRSAVQRLRRKLDSADVGMRIASVRGVGFRLLSSGVGSRLLDKGSRGLNRRSRPRLAPGTMRLLHPSVGYPGRSRN